MTLATIAGVHRLVVGVQGAGTASAQGYACSYNAGTLAVQRFSGGTGTTIGAVASATLPNGQQFACRRAGNMLYINWTVGGVWQTPTARGPDGTYAGPGRLGIGQDTATARTDNFGGGTLPGAAGIGRYLLGR